MFKRVLKIFSLLAAALLAILLALVGYGYYRVVSFDETVLPANYGHVKSELFIGQTPGPLIVGFGGAEGGNAWASDHWKNQRDQFLDSGYSFLAIGYFGSEGIPAKLDRISLDAIHAAIGKAAANPGVNGECVAVIGASKGAELGLALASYWTDIDAVVGIVPANVVFAGHTDAMTTSSFTYHDKALPFVPVPWSAAPSLIVGDLRRAYSIMLEDEAAVDRARIPVEQINGPLFLLSATNDEFWPSTEMSESIVASLKQRNFPYFVQHVAIEGSHHAPLQHFDLIEEFLAQHFVTRCKNSP